MAETATVGFLRVLLTANTAEFDSAMKKVSGTAARVGKDLGNIGRQATSAGRALTTGITLPLVGLAAAASKSAIDFESSFAGVRKTVQATETEFSAMSAAFRQLAKEIPINVNELNRLGEAAGALGIPKAAIVDFARVMAELGVTTNLTSEQAAESIAKIQNIFGAAGKETENFASTLVHLGNNGAATEADILSMATRIAGAGSTIGLTQGQVLGFANALSSVGLEAEAGGTAISRVFVDMAAAVSSGGKELNQFAEVAGMSSAAFTKAFKEDASGAALAFIEGLGRIRTSGGDVLAVLAEMDIKEVRLRDTLLRAAGAGDLLRQSLDMQSVAWKSNTALATEASERFKTTESQLTLLWNRVKDVGITLGNALLPSIHSAIGVLNQLIPYLEQGVKWFGSLPTGVQATAIGFTALIAAAGPALFLFGQLALSAQALVALFGPAGLATKVITLTGGFSGLATSAGTLAAALGPAALVAAVLGAMLAFDQLEQSTRDSLDAVREGNATWSDLPSILGNAVSRGLNPFGAAWRDLSEGIRQAKQAWDVWRHGIGEMPAVSSPNAGKGRGDINLPDTSSLDAAARGIANVGRSAKLTKEELKALSAAQKAANTAADDLNASQDRLTESMRDAGIMTQQVVSTGLAPLIEKLNLAAAVGDTQLRRTLIAVEPAIRKMAQAMRDAGVDASWLLDWLEKLRVEAGSLPRVLETVGQGVANITNEFGLTAARANAVVMDVLSRTDFRVKDTIGNVTDAYRTLGITSRAELQKTAAEAQAAYLAIKNSGTASANEIAAAQKKAEEAARAAASGTRKAWTEVFPQIEGIVKNIGAAVNGSFAQMLLGAKGFKDGFLDIWESIKAGIGQILTSILQDFTNRFLKGLLAAMSGQRGGLAQAFSGMFAGLFGGGGNATAGMILGTGGQGAVIGVPGAGAAATPWWSTAAGGGAIGGAAGGVAGWVVGQQTGNTIGSVGAGAGVGAGVGAAFGGPVGAGIGALIGAGVGWYAAMRERMQTNDERDAFFNQFGPGGTGIGSGFHNVAAKLTEAGAGAGGGQLFQDLITANDGEALAKAIQAVNQALAAFEARTKTATEAEADHAAAIEATKQEYQARIDVLKTEMQSLDAEIKKWDELEAPEEVMGAVEQAAREKIEKQKATVQAALDAQQQAMEAALAATSQAATESGEEAARGITDGYTMGYAKIDERAGETRRHFDDLFGGLRYTIGIDYTVGTLPQVPAAPTPPGFIGGTPDLDFMDFGRESLVRLHGEEAVVPKGDEAAFAARHGLTGSSITPSEIAAGVAMGLRMVGLDKLGTGVGMADALDRTLPGYLPGMVDRNPADVRTKLRTQLGGG